MICVFSYNGLSLVVMSSSSNPVLVIDGVCAMCNGFARFVDQYNPECRFMCAQNEQTIEVLKAHGISAEDAMTSIVLIQEGTVFRGSDAFIQVLLGMNTLFWILGILMKIVPRFIRETVYGAVANNRYRLFGKRDSCSIPSIGMRKKFLHQL
jgi:predicted DCC family thiol-disulfide oxidoreductase YuxK